MFVADVMAVPPALEWGQFGLAGLTIGALFWLVWHLGKRYDAQAKLHRDERKEWRDDANARHADMARALDGLTDAIRDGGSRRRRSTVDGLQLLRGRVEELEEERFNLAKEL
jgi:hypothetical protein